MGKNISQRVAVLGSVVVIALLLLVPTVFKGEFSESWPISRPLSLGLDLKGGVHLVYKVIAEEAVETNLGTKANSIRSQLRNEKVALRSAKVVSDNSIELRFLNPRVAEKGKAYLDTEFSELELENPDAPASATLTYRLPPQKVEEIKRQAVAQSLETIRTRVDKFGVAEPLLQRVGSERILLQMPGVSDVEKVKRIVGRVARLEFRFVSSGSGGVSRKRREGSTVKVEEDIQMTGAAVENAQMVVGAGQVEVHLTFTREGARTFRQITAENVGRQLAIILDDVVYSDPVIREAISGGQATISGGFDPEEAQQLAVVLKAGALPASLEVLEERTVGPTLGQESIEKGVIAIGVSLLAVALFMMWYYGKAGFIAVGSLVLNLLLILACLSFFGATLTLPGLAGLALTVGMAVDSNIIIYERIRDELANGSTRDAAVSAGFDKASSAIFDANITGLITGIILYYFGTGPVRGFAVTTTIGMITTLFCAVFAARLAFDAFPLRGRKELSI